MTRVWRTQLDALQRRASAEEESDDWIAENGESGSASPVSELRGSVGIVEAILLSGTYSMRWGDRSQRRRVARFSFRLGAELMSRQLSGSLVIAGFEAKAEPTAGDARRSDKTTISIQTLS